jgi:nicotinamidase-related amidase
MNALLVVDVQQNMFAAEPALHRREELLERVRALVAGARSAGAPVVFVRNCGGPEDPDVKGTPGWELHDALVPRAGELLVDKDEGNALAGRIVGTGELLGAWLAGRGAGRVTLCGMQSEWCITRTAEGVLAAGMGLDLVADAHSTFDGRTSTAAAVIGETNRAFAARPGVRVLRADQVAFERPAQAGVR